MPTGWATITFGQAARRSLAERPSRISWVSRLAAVRARSRVAASVTPAPSRSEALTCWPSASDLICADAPWTSTTRMFNDQRRATSSISVAKLSSVTMAPSIARMNVFSRNWGMYCRMPRRSVSFTGQLLAAKLFSSPSSVPAAGNEYSCSGSLCQVTKLLQTAATSRFDNKTGKLPQVRFIDQWRAPLPEQAGPALERRPVGPDRGAGSQVGSGDVENVPVRQLVGHENALVRVADHEGQPSQHRGGDLKRRRVLPVHQLACLADLQLRAGPPAVQAVAHEQHAQFVDAIANLIGHDSELRLQLVVAHGQLVETQNRVVAGHIGVVHRRSIDRQPPFDRVLPDGEVVADAEGLGVADHHPDDRSTGRDPGVNEGPNARLGEKDLIARSANRRVSIPREAALVRSPPEFGRCRAFLVKALNRPRVDELVDRLRLRGHLRIALRDVDDLGAGGLAESSKRCLYLTLGVGDELLERRRVETGDHRPPFFEDRCGDLEQGSLREVADEARIRTVIDDGGRTRFALRIELVFQQPDPHLTGIQTAFVGGLVFDVAVGIPLLEGRVEVADIVLATPGQEVERLDVPGKVDDDVARAHELTQHRRVVLSRQPRLPESHSSLQGVLDLRTHILEVHDGDAVGRHVDVAAHELQGALANRSAPEHENPSVERRALRVLHVLDHPNCPSTARDVPRSVSRDTTDDPAAGCGLGG